MLVRAAVLSESFFPGLNYKVVYPSTKTIRNLSRGMGFPTMWHMRSLIRSFASRLNILCVLSY